MVRHTPYTQKQGDLEGWRFHIHHLMNPSKVYYSLRVHLNPELLHPYYSANSEAPK
uniref:Uncharacterized protein n=1 Tax=Rhizophora mucronata TaxID=61149 RepID=A0A2P2L3X6_RHIMU